MSKSPPTLLITHRYFWPDTPPYGLMLKRIALHFQDRGVNVFSTIPSYHGTDDSKKGSKSARLKGIQITRIPVLRERNRGSWARGINAIAYAAALFVHVVTKRPKVVMASTFPPVIAALSACLASKCTRAKFVYHLMDVYPDVHWVSSQKRPGLFLKVVRSIDTFTMRLADAIVVLSSNMKRTVEGRGIRSELISVINNFELEAENHDAASGSSGLLRDLRQRIGIDEQALVVLFSGNLGGFQALDTVADLVRSLADVPQVQFVFLGDGRERARLESGLASCVGKTVHFLDYVPVAVARDYMAQADFNLVPLSAGVSSCSYPSKALTVASVGGAFLVIDDADSALSASVRSHNAGLAFTHAEVNALSVRLQEISRDQRELACFQDGSKNLYAAEYCSVKTTAKWQALIDGLIARR